MTNLLLTTLAMMGLTFLIGFFVAAVIKLIAYVADSMDFYSSHRLELLRIHRRRQYRQKLERLVHETPLTEAGDVGDYREDYSRGINRNAPHYSDLYHGVSLGASEKNLMDYYYPKDTRDFYLKEEEKAHTDMKNAKKANTNKK